MLSATRFALFPALFASVLLTQDASRADVVILKDGTTLYGNLGKDVTAISDPVTGDVFPISRVNALKFIDDGPRWTVFSDHKSRLGDVDNKFNKFANLEVLHSILAPGPRENLPSAMSYDKTTDFDKNLARVVHYRSTTSNGRYEFKQRVTVLSPHYIRLDCINFKWTCYYSTQEIGPDIIRFLLDNHPDLREKDGKADLGKRSRKVRFYLQANWFDEAKRDLDELARLLPEESKEKVEQFRKEIRDTQVQTAVKYIETYKENGQHRVAKTLLKQLPKDLPGKDLPLKVAAADAAYKNLDKQYESAKRLLESLVEQEVKPPFLIDAGKTILGELGLDNAARLETFVLLAQQAEDAKKADKKVLHEPDQLLALAVTGWLLGNNAAEAKVETAQKAWLSREMVLTYQRTVSPFAREKLLTEYVKASQKLGVDELAQLISTLPPPEAEEKPPTKPEKRTTGPVPGLTDGVDYLISLPPEYTHGRPYPLLILLPNGNEALETTLRKFGEYPQHYGYITAVLRWNGGFRNDYTGTPEEHATVTGLVWHLRRKYQVNSDRVYLFGAGEGADMAIDIGASHPDLFAGVIPMGPRPSWFYMKEYWRNFQTTPLYLISGDLAGSAVSSIRNCLDKWMPAGYPVLGVLYKGRGNEFFGAEMPYLFDWMPRQTRATGIPSVGRAFGLSGSDGEDYRTFRPTDNSFYWITADTIQQNYLIDPTAPPPKRLPGTAASIYGKINEGNQFLIRTRGVEAATVWFGKGMIDFDKPVKVQWNGAERIVNGNKPLAANFGVLLEDLYARGDRQRPYFEKLKLEPLTGKKR